MGTVALYVFFFLGGPWGYRFHPIKNLRNCDQDFVAPFNSNSHNKTLCESRVMWITRFVTYLSIAFHIYSIAKRENTKSVSFQGLSQCGINEKSVSIRVRSTKHGLDGQNAMSSRGHHGL